MHYSCKTPDENKIHTGVCQAFEQIGKIATHIFLAFRSFMMVFSAIWCRRMRSEQLLLRFATSAGRSIPYSAAIRIWSACCD